MDKTDLIVTGWLILWGGLAFATGMLLGYRSCERYWRGRDQWFRTAETITDQMAKDGWQRP